MPDRPEWQSAIAVIRKKAHAFQSAIQDSAFLVHLTRRTPAPVWQRDVEPLRSVLLRSRSSAARQAAAATLARDGNEANGVIAVVVLANAPESDTTWWSLAEALRDPRGMVDATAQQVLDALARFAPRRVDWAPALESVEAVLAGTNLWGHNTMMRALVATEVSPSLAKPLLRRSAPLILAKLVASERAGRELAHRLLIQLRGRDLGTDPAPWADWIRGINEERGEQRLEDMTGLALRPLRGLAPRVVRSRQSHMRPVALSQSLRGGPTHVISSSVAPFYYLPRLGCAQGVDHHRRAAAGRRRADARRAIAERRGAARAALPGGRAHRGAHPHRGGRTRPRCGALPQDVSARDPQVAALHPEVSRPARLCLSRQQAVGRQALAVAPHLGRRAVAARVGGCLGLPRVLRAAGVQDHAARRTRPADRSARLVAAEATAVGWLQCFRGLQRHSAMVLATEIVDWRRFARPTQLMAYLGLVPREASSGERERKGSITKAGNHQCRHVLVQAAWKAQHRLHKLYQHLAYRKRPQIAAVAVARELVGFLWAVMQELPVQPAATTGAAA